MNKLGSNLPIGSLRRDLESMRTSLYSMIDTNTEDGHLSIRIHDLMWSISNHTISRFMLKRALDSNHG